MFLFLEILEISVISASYTTHADASHFLSDIFKDQSTLGRGLFECPRRIYEIILHV